MELQQAVKAMGDVFAGLAVREPQPRASEAFRLFGEQHRSMEKVGHDMVKKVKPVSNFPVFDIFSDHIPFHFYNRCFLIWVHIYTKQSQTPDWQLKSTQMRNLNIWRIAWRWKRWMMRNVATPPCKNRCIGLKQEITSTGKEDYYVNLNTFETKVTLVVFTL